MVVVAEGMKVGRRLEGLWVVVRPVPSSSIEAGSGRIEGWPRIRSVECGKTEYVRVTVTVPTSNQNPI